MVADHEQIYESTCTQLSRTLQNLLDSHHELNQRAIDLAKINLLSISVVVSGVAFVSGLREALVPISAGVLALLYSLWCCVDVYRPRRFARGIGSDAVDEVRDAVSDGASVGQHYDNLMGSYGAAIAAFQSTYDDEVESYRNALWSSVASILFLVAAVVRLTLPYFGPVLDALALLVIPVVSLWRKNKYERD